MKTLSPLQTESWAKQWYILRNAAFYKTQTWVIRLSVPMLKTSNFHCVFSEWPLQRTFTAYFTDVLSTIISINASTYFLYCECEWCLLHKPIIQTNTIHTRNTRNIKFIVQKEKNRSENDNPSVNYRKTGAVTHNISEPLKVIVSS